MTEPLSYRPADQPRRVDRIDLNSLRAAFLEARKTKPVRRVLGAHQALVANPNDDTTELPFFETGEVGVTAVNSYRIVDFSAIEDLADVGIVRNPATARTLKDGAPNTSKDGDKVFWANGIDHRYHRLIPPREVLIVAPKSAIDAGWVTIRDISHIYARDNAGQIVDLIGED